MARQYFYTGTAAPTTTPTFAGEIFVDTTAGTIYFATGTTSSADWDPMPLNLSDLTIDTDLALGGLYKIKKALGMDFQSSAELTIATGAVTQTQSYHTVDTEADSASDDLDTITIATDMSVLLLTLENAARIVTLKHGTGNLNLPDDADIVMAENTVYFLLYNGTAWNLVGSSASGGGSGISNTYTFSTTTTATDPGADGMKWNSATPASVTEIYINDTANGVDISSLIDFLSPGDTLYIQETDTQANYILVTISSITDNTGWYTIAVTVDDSGTLPTNTGTVGISFGRGSLSLDNSVTDATTAKTLALSDVGKTIRMTSASANVITIPLNSSVPLPVNAMFLPVQDGSGQTTVTAAASVTLNGSVASSFVLGTQYAGSVLTQVSANTWTISRGFNANEVHSYTKQQNFGTTTLTDGANISWDLDNNQVSKVTLAGNRTLDNPTNMVDGGTYILRVIQDATGSRTLAYGSAYKWPLNVTPVLSTGANDVDIISFVSDGTFMFGVVSLDFA